MSVIDFTLTLSLCKGKLSLTLTGCPRAAPSPVTNLEIFIMSKTATITYKLPTTLVDGAALSPDDIEYVDIMLSSDGGATYTSIGHAVPTLDAVQSFIQPELEDGDYLVQAVIVDDQVPPVLSAPVSVPFSVVSTTVPRAAPMPVTELTVTLS